MQRVFVVEHVRTMLLEHAEAIGAERAIVDRFADITCQPGAPHDDHMHIRVFCTSEDIAAGCRDTKPVYPWHREHLTAAGVKPKMATGRRREAIELKSPAQARAEAGALDVAVEEFLDRRKAWLKKPRTGRPYCR